MPYTGWYCADTDLLIGDVTLTNADTLIKKHIDAAADVIDASIGAIYLTPIDRTKVTRVAWLLLKNIALHIASGRLLMEIDQSGEDSKVHQYALYLLQQADMSIDAINKGTVSLLEAPVEGVPDPIRGKVLLNNLDPYSQVEEFYRAAARPSFPGYPAYGFGGYPYGMG